MHMHSNTIPAKRINVQLPVTALPAICLHSVNFLRWLPDWLTGFACAFFVASLGCSQRVNLQLQTHEVVSKCLAAKAAIRDYRRQAFITHNM